VFPWADLSVDQARYREEERAEYVNECGHWDAEDQTYLFAEDFDDWYAARDAAGLRPYGEDATGEVAFWRLQLSLNDLGKRTLERALSQEHIELLLQLDREDAEQEAQLAGYYEGIYGDMPIGRSIEVVQFTAGDTSDSIIGNEQLWTAPETRPITAAAILEHVMGRSPTRATVDAFLARFGPVFGDDGQGWVLSHREVREWLDELRA
jgi:hypothetical protein